MKTNLGLVQQLLSTVRRRRRPVLKDGSVQELCGYATMK